MDAQRPPLPAFLPLDYDGWDRREIFEYFDGTLLYLTVHLDITDFLRRVKARGIRFYPAVIHCLAGVVNGCPDFRYGRDDTGNMGRWERVDPLYTVPRKDKPHLFSMAVTPYQKDFGAFYAAFQQDYSRAEHCGRLVSGGEIPPHVMGVTAVPGLHFSSFAFGDTGSRPDFTPFVALGGYREEGGRVKLPVFGEFLHAVNDGYHVSLFFQRLESALQNF